MLRVSAMYTNRDDAWFDFELYRSQHFPFTLHLRTSVDLPG